jgi:hypothetical protein
MQRSRRLGAGATIIIIIIKVRKLLPGMGLLLRS